MAKRDGKIKKMGSLFQIYKDRLVAPQKTVIDAAVEVVHDILGITLDKNRVTYTVATRTIASNAPAIIRQEIQKHEAEIILHVGGRIGVKNAPLRVI